MYGLVQPIEITRLSDRHFWHGGYDKAKLLAVTARDCCRRFQPDADGTTFVDIRTQAHSAAIRLTTPRQLLAAAFRTTLKSAETGLRTLSFKLLLDAIQRSNRPAPIYDNRIYS